MKSNILLTLSLLLEVSLIAQKNKPGYEINVKFTNMKDTSCILMHYYGDKQMIKDTAKVDAKGNMTFKGANSLDGGMYIVVMPSKRFFELVIDKEQHFSVQCDTITPIKTMKVNGSQNNTLFYEYQRFISDKSAIAEPLSKSLSKTKNQDSIKAIQIQLGEIDKEVKTYKKNYIKQHPETFLAKIFLASSDPEVPDAPLLQNGRKDSTFGYRYFKAHYWDNIDLTDDRLMRTPVIHNKLKYYFDKMILQLPDTINKEVDLLAQKAKSSKEIYKYIVYYITYTYETSKYMGMDAVFVHMGNTYYKSKELTPWVDSTNRAKIMSKVHILEKLLIGLQAPPLILPDSSGAFSQLYSIKSKYTILFFWDPECGHCKKSTPILKAFYDKYKDQGIEVFAVDIEDNKTAWKKYIKEKNLNWVNCSNATGDGKVYYNLKTYYDVYSTPVIYVLDENKKIVAKRIDAEQIEQFFINQLRFKKK